MYSLGFMGAVCGLLRVSESRRKEPSPHCPRRCGDQPGIALLAGLVLLAAISLLALVATASMILQQNMAGNFTDSQQARQGAAVAVSQGQAVLFGIGPDGR